MRTPIRKPGKYTNIQPDPYITQEKFNKLKASLNRLINIDRPPAIKEVKEQAAFGDFSENAAYGIAKGKLRSINYRILKIEGYIRNAIIIEEGQKNNTAQLGSEVTIESNGKIKTYRILGSAEVDVYKGVISHNSPIGAGLMGKKVGDVIKIKDKEIRITAIN